MVVHSFPKDIFESENAQKYAKAPGTAAIKVEITPEMFGPNFSVISEDNFFRGYADIGGDLVNVAMDEELAYGLTKAFLDGQETLMARTPFMPTIWMGKTSVDFTGMCGAMPMKYHPVRCARGKRRVILCPIAPSPKQDLRQSQKTGPQVGLLPYRSVKWC